MINQKYSVMQPDRSQPRWNVWLHSTAKYNFKKASVFKIYPTCNYFELNDAFFLAALDGLNVVVVGSFSHYIHLQLSYSYFVVLPFF